MPQLDIAAFAPQLVWLAISFVVLYLLMARVALPRITEVLEERHDRIADDLEQAQKLRQERAHAMGTEAREAAAAEAAKRGAEHDARMHETLAEAEARITAARNEAMGNLREVASEAARAATAKLIGIEVESPAAFGAVDAALEEGE
jgi:F-type H+-transporting ATPase subunit b